MHISCRRGSNNHSANNPFILFYMAMGGYKKYDDWVDEDDVRESTCRNLGRGDEKE